MLQEDIPLIICFGSSSSLRLTGVSGKAHIHQLSCRMVVGLTVGIHQGNFSSEKVSERPSAQLQPVEAMR